MQRPEETLQRAIVAYLDRCLLPPWIFWATPNQRGTRKVYEQTILKALGVRAGVPDLFILGPGARLIGIEVKAPAKQTKRGASKAKPVLNDAQKAMFPRLAELGVPVVIVRDVDDMVSALRTMGAPFRGRLM